MARQYATPNKFVRSLADANWRIADFTRTEPPADKQQKNGTRRCREERRLHSQKTLQAETRPAYPSTTARVSNESCVSRTARPASEHVPQAEIDSLVAGASLRVIADRISGSAIVADGAVCSVHVSALG